MVCRKAVLIDGVTESKTHCKMCDRKSGHWDAVVV